MVELLVVISIIAILASMLLPALSKARDSAKSIVCLNQLKQMGLSALSYVQDHDGCFFPRSDDVGHVWYQSCTGAFGGDYLGLKWKAGDYWKNSIIDCPSKNKGYGGQSMDYIYNNNLGIYNCLWYGKVSRIKKTSQTIVFGEVYDYDSGLPCRYYFQRWGTYDPGDAAIDWGHNKGSNILFVDGHASNVKGVDRLNFGVVVYDPRQE